MIKFIELFAGIGGFRYGLENCGGLLQRETSEDIQDMPDTQERQIRFTCVWANEIDKYACQIYRKNYGGGDEQDKGSGESLQGAERTSVRPIGDKSDIEVGRNQQSKTRGDRVKQQSQDNYDQRSKLYEGDITKIDTDLIPDHDLLVGGVPCQAWSIAGKRKGFEDSRGTMWFECFRIIEAKKPKFIILENVKGILSHNGGNSFERICECICELGYAIDFEVLNSKNFGVPQNRERVFIIGIRLDLLDKCQLF